MRSSVIPMWQKKIQDWSDNLTGLRKGEDIMNKATNELGHDLKNLASEKGESFQKMVAKTKMIKEKVEIYEQATQKLKNLTELAQEREKTLLGHDRKLELKSGLANLKVRRVRFAFLSLNRKR